jgi:hypothetical protein
MSIEAARQRWWKPEKEEKVTERSAVVAGKERGREERGREG